MSDNVNVTPSAPVNEAPAADAPLENLEADLESSGQEGQEAPKSVEMKKIEKEIARKLKIKFEGKEEELDEEEVVKLAQLGKMGHKKAQEKAELEKNLNEFIARLQQDPFSVLSDPRLGVDVKQQIVKYIEAQAEEEAKTPEQKQQEKATKELEELRNEKKRLEEERKADRIQREQEKAAQEINTNIESAIKKHGLPNTAYVQKRFADFLITALDNNIDVGPNEIAPLVYKEIEAEIKDMFSVAPDEMIEQFLGKDRIGSMKKRRLTEVQQKLQQAAPPKDTGSTVTKKDEPSRKLTMKDFLKLK